MIFWAAKQGRAVLRLPAWPTRRKAIRYLEDQLERSWDELRRDGYRIVKIEAALAEGLDGEGSEA